MVLDHNQDLLDRVVKWVMHPHRNHNNNSNKDKYHRVVDLHGLPCQPFHLKVHLPMFLCVRLLQVRVQELLLEEVQRLPSLLQSIHLEIDRISPTMPNQSCKH